MGQGGDSLGLSESFRFCHNNNGKPLFQIKRNMVRKRSGNVLNLSFAVGDDSFLFFTLINDVVMNVLGHKSFDYAAAGRVRHRPSHLIGIEV